LDSFNLFFGGGGDASGNIPLLGILIGSDICGTTTHWFGDRGNRRANLSRRDGRGKQKREEEKNDEGEFFEHVIAVQEG